MKDRILQVVSENISLYGLKKFNLDVVSAELKISKKTIYKYFSSKDEIVKEYFKQIISTDKESVLSIIKENISLSDKFHKIIYSYHKYILPISVIQETKLYYPDQWNEINRFKEFKVNAILNVLSDAKKNGEIKGEVDITIITLIIEKLSEELLKGSVLSKNNLKLNYAADQILQIILNGISN